MKDSKQVKKIVIFKNDLEAGHLHRVDNGCELHFNKDYIENHFNERLTYHLLVENQPLKFTGVGLPPYFAGLLPEGLRLKALVRKVKTSEDDLFSLLVASGNDPVGDLHFEWQDSAEAKKKSKEHDDLPNDFEWVQRQLKMGIDPGHKSLAGVQNKISADRISLPLKLKNTNKSYILKLAAPDFPDLVMNEKVCLDIAKKCGLAVNTAKIVKDKAGVQALLVERFDRSWTIQKKAVIRHHQEDACQFLDRYPSDKYIISMQEIADGLKIWCASPEIEILNLLRQKAFSYLIGNGDFHAKNVSLLQAGAKAASQLSPAYDIVCTAVYGDLKMAILMDGKNQNLKRKNFIEFASRYNIPSAAIESMLDRLVKQFSKSNELIFLVPIAQKKEKFLSQLFTQRTKHLADF